MSSTECPADVLTESNTGEDETMAEKAEEARLWMDPRMMKMIRPAQTCSNTLKLIKTQ